MNLIVAIPTPFFNFVVIFVCIAVIFWVIRAGKRFSRNLVLRSAALERSLVLIRGLGNNLIFFDGANQQHMHSLVHTRQAKPPAMMKMLIVPYCVANGMCESSNSQLIFKCNLSITTGSYIVVLFGFDSASFVSSFDRHCQVSRGIFANFLVKSSANYGAEINADGLISSGCCTAVGPMMELNDGLHEYSTVISSSATGLNGEVIAIFVIPRLDVLGPVSRRVDSSTRSEDIELANLSSDHVENAIHIEAPTCIHTEGSVRLSFGAVVMEFPGLRMFATSRAPTTIIKANSYEQIQCTSEGHLYNCLEIYGMKSGGLVSRDTGGAHNNLGTSAGGNDADKLGTDDECVVCLTERKAVALLPCRHLCVCIGCLAFIDRCPVCRATFAEYICTGPDKVSLHQPTSSRYSRLSVSERSI